MLSQPLPSQYSPIIVIINPGKYTFSILHPFERTRNRDAHCPWSHIVIIGKGRRSRHVARPHSVQFNLGHHQPHTTTSHDQTPPALVYNSHLKHLTPYPLAQPSSLHSLSTNQLENQPTTKATNQKTAHRHADTIPRPHPHSLPHSSNSPPHCAPNQ